MSKEITGFRPGSKKWKQFMAKLYGLGGAVVILGALFKIQHYPGSSIMLIAGLGTETIIFIFSAFEPLHEDPDWSLVYPELAGLDEDEEGEELEEATAKKQVSSGDEKSVTEQLDDMLEEAKIEPELLESLGSGLRSLGNQAEKLNNITDASVATNEYTESLRNASDSVGKLSDSYVKASESLAGLSVSNEAGQTYGEQLQKVSQNLSALNNVYEMQLKGSSEQLEASKKMFEGIGDLMQNLNDSVEDTKRYKENIKELSENLSALNTVYGNMLTAMNFNSPAGGSNPQG